MNCLAQQECLAPTARRIAVLLGCSLFLAFGVAAQQQRAQSSEATQKSLTPRQQAWKMLNDGLADKSGDKRAKAVYALGLLFGNREAEKAARTALTDEKCDVRVAAATALGSMHAVRAIPDLEAALDDQEPTVVLASANSLMLLKDSDSAYNVYYGLLTGSVRPNRGLIHEQMKTLQDPKKMAELGFEEGIGFVPFAGLGYGVFKTVQKSESGSGPLRAAAAKKLARDPNPASGQALVAATKDHSWMVRAAALEAIAQRGDNSLLPEVMGSLEDTKEEVRFAAASCVIRLSDWPEKHELVAKKLP